MSDAARNPRFSVVVCCYNGEAMIGETLAHIQRQSLDADAFEVIVVDDGSTDRTAEVASASGARVVSLYPNCGLAAARNAGIHAAAGEIVAFTDDDCEPAEHWLEALDESFADPLVDGVGGQVIAASTDGLVLRYLAARPPVPFGAELLVSNRLSYRLRLYLRNVWRSPPSLAPGAVLFTVVGANMAFRRQVMLDVSGFDEAFRFGGEEEEFCRRVNSRPGRSRLVYQPRAIIVHRFQATMRYAVNRSRWYGRGNARSALKHPDARLIVYPFPLLVFLSLLAAVVTKRRTFAGIGLLIPLLGYARWPVDALRRKSLEPLTYPYLQLTEEACTMLGEFEGHRAGYVPVPSRQLGEE
ncbi:MAG: glycosyltransferase [Solirubrobacteraceae bacterium]